MANKKKEEEGKRISFQLPVSDYDATALLAAKRKQSLSDFVRRAVDFQAWLESVMPDVEGFGADELAKIKLARKQLSELEQEAEQLSESVEPRDGNSGGEPRQNGFSTESQKPGSGIAKPVRAASH